MTISTSSLVFFFFFFFCCCLFVFCCCCTFLQSSNLLLPPIPLMIPMQAGVRGAGSAHATYPGSAEGASSQLGWFASIKPFLPAARLRFGFASTVAIKVGAFSTIKRSSWQPGFFASLFFGLKTPHSFEIVNQLKQRSREYFYRDNTRRHLLLNRLHCHIFQNQVGVFVLMTRTRTPPR